MSRGISVREAEALVKRATGQAPPKGRVPSASRPPKQPNKWEQAYFDQVLYPQYAAGEITFPKYESVKLKYGTGAYYTPDWVCWRIIAHRPNSLRMALGTMEVHEVKGHWFPAGKARFKAARLNHPEVEFFAKTLDGRMWVDA